MPDFRFPKSRRLLKPAEFERVFAAKRSQGDGMLVVYGCTNDLPTPRLGLVVSRKCGDAVTRNRWKRCIRDAFRLAQHELPPGLDLLAMPRVGATPTMPRVRQSLVTLAGRIAKQQAPSQRPGRPE
jgi:ribonuclease P protein component